MAAWTIPVGRQVCYNVELTIEKAVSIMSIDQLTSTQIMETSPDAGSMTQEELIEEINRLRKERNAVILAHNYQIPEIQDIADFTGDSLGLARQAAKTDADLIVFCGVHFMAETAAILSPGQKGAPSRPGSGLFSGGHDHGGSASGWKKQHPGAVVVAYVNTSAEVKAETDICCTSSNAVEVVQSIPEDKEILFLPDMFLGSYVEKMTGRKKCTSGWASATCTPAIHPDDVQELREASRGGAIDPPRVRLQHLRDVRGGRRWLAFQHGAPFDGQDDQARGQVAGGDLYRRDRGGHPPPPTAGKSGQALCARVGACGVSLYEDDHVGKSVPLPER